MKDRQDVIRKIRKLLALAQSSNEHEAGLALAKAHELMLAFELSEDDVAGSEDRGPKWVFVEAFRGPRRGSESAFVGMIVRRFFFCEIIQRREPCDPWSRDDGQFVTVLEIFGDERHAIVARYVFVFLTRTFQELWLRRKREKRLTNRSRKSYFHGLYTSLCQKLSKQQDLSAAGRSSQNALVRLRNDVARALSQELPGLRSAASRPDIELDPEGYHCGLRDGENINLRTPVGDQSAPKALING